ITLSWFDTSGPRVVSSTPFVLNDAEADTTSGYTSTKTIRVTFDEPVVPGTFSPQDIVSFTGPDGLGDNVINVSVVDGSGNRSFDITFEARQSGVYTFVLGPRIRDGSAGADLGTLVGLLQRISQNPTPSDLEELNLDLGGLLDILSHPEEHPEEFLD